DRQGCRQGRADRNRGRRGGRNHLRGGEALTQRRGRGEPSQGAPLPRRGRGEPSQGAPLPREGGSPPRVPPSQRLAFFAAAGARLVGGADLVGEESDVQGARRLVLLDVLAFGLVALHEVALRATEA